MRKILLLIYVTLRILFSQKISSPEKDYPVNFPPSFHPLPPDDIRNLLLRAAEIPVQDNSDGLFSSVKTPRLYLACYEITHDKKYLNMAFTALTSTWNRFHHSQTKLLYKIDASGTPQPEESVMSYIYSLFIWQLAWYLQLAPNNEINAILEEFGDAVWKYCSPNQQGWIGELKPISGEITRPSANDYYIEWTIWCWLEAFAATGAEKYADRARKMTSFFWNLRDPSTDIVPGSASWDQTKYKKTRTSIAHIGFFIGSMFRGGLCTGDSFFIDLGLKAGAAFEKYYWDEELGRYINWCDTDGAKHPLYSIGIEQLDGFLLYAAYTDDQKISEHIYRHFQFIWQRIWSIEKKTFFTLRLKDNVFVPAQAESVNRHPAAFLGNTSYFLGNQVYSKYGTLGYLEAFGSYLTWYNDNKKDLSDEQWYGIYNDWIKSTAFIGKPRLIASTISCRGLHRIWGKNDFEINVAITNNQNKLTAGHLIFFLRKIPDGKRYKTNRGILKVIDKNDPLMSRVELNIELRPKEIFTVQIQPE